MEDTAARQDAAVARQDAVAREPFSVITLGAAATPFADGELYGLLARAAIERSITAYKRIFYAQCGLAWDAVLGVAEDVVGRLPLELVAEMKGVAEGAAVPWQAIVALNVRTEILAHGRSLQQAARECTTVADMQHLAQNWDWQTAMSGNCVILKRPTHVCLTEAGILSKIGVNVHGIGVALNLLQSRGDGLPRVGHADLPVHLVLHAILKTARSLTDVARLTASSSASSCITAMDGAGTVACFELSPHGCFTVPTDARGQLVHTNHFLSAQGQATETQQSHAATSLERLQAARELLAAQSDGVSAGGLRSLLALHSGRKSLCRHDGDITTIACIVLHCERRAMDVCGQPCSGEAFRTICCDE